MPFIWSETRQRLRAKNQADKAWKKKKFQIEEQSKAEQLISCKLSLQILWIWCYFMTSHKRNMADANTPLISSLRSHAISIRGFVLEWISVPTGVYNQRSNDSWDYCFCPSWNIREGLCEGPLHDIGHIDFPTHQHLQWIFSLWIWIITHSD